MYSLLDYTYHGWGHKWNSFSFTVQPLSGYQQSDSYRDDTSKTAEVGDPTREDELLFFSMVKQRMEQRANRKIYALRPFSAADEDEEKIINQHDYD